MKKKNTVFCIIFLFFKIAFHQKSPIIFFDEQLYYFRGRFVLQGAQLSKVIGLIEILFDLRELLVNLF
jgi:hypothetical protein